MQPHFECAAAGLTKDDIERFSRQMLCDGIGAAGMARIRQTHVVCVGVGGLGSTAALYLVAGGIGKLTLVDFDAVELSNLHRQVIHQAGAVGQPKVESAARACRALNPRAVIVPQDLRLTPANAVAVLGAADLIVDATDNVAARYLINDAAARLGRPLVSGSAVRWEGQLAVYGHAHGPCYRCLFPQPPPPETVGSCANVGVMGPVPGMIGCLQALEALKLAAGAGVTLSGRMLVFDGLRLSMKVVELRPRKADCKACGEAARADRETTLSELMQRDRPEYAIVSCPAAGKVADLPTALEASTQAFLERWGAQHLPKYDAPQPGDLCDGANRNHPSPWTLCIDVRPRQQYDMAHLPRTFSLPLTDLQRWDTEGVLRERFMEFLRNSLEADFSCVKTLEQEADDMQIKSDGTTPHKLSPIDSLEDCEVFVICRRGVSSVKAMHTLLKLASSSEDGLLLLDLAKEEPGADRGATSRQIKTFFRNVTGGLNAYHRQVDADFPFY